MSENNTPMSDQSPVQSTGDNEKTAAGPIVGIVIIIIVLGLGGLYFWGQRIVKEGVLGDEKTMNDGGSAAGTFPEGTSGDVSDTDTLPPNLEENLEESVN